MARERHGTTTCSCLLWAQNDLATVVPDWRLSAMAQIK